MGRGKSREGGSPGRFGSLSFMAKYLHEHQCNLLFMEQRCCGESEGKYITFGAKEKWDVQRRQIENDVKKNPAFFCFAAVTGYNSESGGKKSPVACFFARFSAAAGVIDNGGRSSH